ncbi:DUF308 domain-containing protein [Fructilactobacillus vespulae]|uniref:DUF308 domain-containing protein n=1 Tax=Fructilactobacillus vespulae TaxID=1249630 RepID=UPI0039B5C60F
MFKSNKSFDPFTLVVGIIFTVISLIIIHNPINSIKTIIFIVAFALIFEGIIKMIDILNLDKNLGINNNLIIFNGIFDLILGIVLVSFPDLAIAYMGIMLAIWFIFDSILEIWFTKFIKMQNKSYYWLNLIMGIIGIIFGLILLVNPGIAVSIALLLLAFYLLFFGIILIIRSF